MKLEYVGPALSIDAAIPLPEGWPAADHDEPDSGAAAAKLASGLYREAGRSRRQRTTEEVTDHAGDSTAAQTADRD